MIYRIIEENNVFYPQYYHNSWFKIFSGWKFFKELQFGSFNPPTPDTYENVCFKSKNEAVCFIEKQNKPTIEIVYENSK